MIEPREFEPAKVKITYYKHHCLYTAGTRARVSLHGMIGIKDGKIVDITHPGSEPYLVVSNKGTRRGLDKYYASDGENYFDLDYVYNIQTREHIWSIDQTPSYRTKLTTLHQAVIKRVLDDYLTEQLKNDN